MKRLSLLLYPLALASLLVAGSVVRADFIEWRYNFTPNVSELLSDTANAPDSTPSKIKLSNEPFADAANSSDIVATNISVLSGAPRNNPDQFTSNGNFSLAFQLIDKEAQMAGDPNYQKNLTFSGHFFGTLSNLSSNIQLGWDSPTNYTFQLGNNEYTIKFKAFAPPGPPSASQKGSITFDVDVRPLNLQKAPEPSSVVLAGMGLSMLGLASWRKRRQQKAAQAN